MDLYEQLISLEYLGLSSNTKVLEYNLKKLYSVSKLFSKSCIIDDIIIDNELKCKYHSIKVYKGGAFKDSDNLKIVCKKWNSREPIVIHTTYDEAIARFIAVSNSRRDVEKMLKTIK